MEIVYVHKKRVVEAANPLFLSFGIHKQSIVWGLSKHYVQFKLDPYAIV